MIPTYNRSQHLHETLRSVLAQDPGPDRMQIEVVDNCSTEGNVLELVKSIAGQRIAVHRNETNLGMAGNFNRCIERARGTWIHLLHSDDYVLPGFYTLAESVAQAEDADAIAMRCLAVDEQGVVAWLTQNLSGGDPVLKTRENFIMGTPLQCPGVVMKRSVYEAVGGYRPELVYTVDVEMWSRAFPRCKVVYRPECLACYRIHPESESDRMKDTLADLEDLFRTQSLVASNLGWGQDEVAFHRRACLRRAHQRAMSLAVDRNTRALIRCLGLAWRESSGTVEVIAFVARLRQCLFAWAKHRDRKRQPERHAA